MPEENKKNPEKSPEEPEKKEIQKPKKGIGSLFSPEALVMFFFAGMLDLIGLILLLFALDDFWITDIIGLIFLGGWMFLRSGTITATKGAKKAGTKFLKRIGFSFLGEIIPFFGGIAPCWTLAVYFELRGS